MRSRGQRRSTSLVGTQLLRTKLSSVDACHCVLHRGTGFRPPICVHSTDQFEQTVNLDELNIVEIRNTRMVEAIALADGELGGNVSDRRSDGCSQHAP